MTKKEPLLRFFFIKNISPLNDKAVICPVSVEISHGDDFTVLPEWTDFVSVQNSLNTLPAGIRDFMIRQE
jgi:hypothetical protein